MCAPIRLEYARQASPQSDETHQQNHRFHAAFAATRENTVKGAETASEASEASDICPTICEVLVVIERYLKAALEGS